MKQSPRNPLYNVNEPNGVSPLLSRLFQNNIKIYYEPSLQDETGLLVDFSGNGNHGTLAGGTAIGNGKATFDGVDGKITQALNNTSEYTIIALVNIPITSVVTGTNYIAGNYYTSVSIPMATNIPKIHAYYTDNSEVEYASDKAIVRGQDIVVSMTMRDSDFVAIGVNRSYIKTSITKAFKKNTLWIGYKESGMLSQMNLKRLVVLNRALSEQEYLSVVSAWNPSMFKLPYNRLAGATCEYDFSYQDSTTAATDLSGNANNGTVTGATLGLGFASMDGVDDKITTGFTTVTGQPFTKTYVFKADQNPTDRGAANFFSYHLEGTSSSLLLYIDVSGSNNASYTVKPTDTYNGDRFFTAIPHVITVTSEGTVGSTQFFIDGVKNQPNYSNPEVAFTGVADVLGDRGTSTNFLGKFYHFSGVQSVLSDAEIIALHARLHLEFPT